MHYLDKDIFSVRQALAAYYVKGYRRIFEVGCGNNPLYNYLDSYDLFVGVDPNVEPLITDTVKLYRRKLGEQPNYGSFDAIVALGVDLRRNTNQVIGEFFGLLSDARVVVIEASRWDTTSRILTKLGFVVESCGFYKYLSINLDILNEDVCNLDHSKRIFEVWRK